MSPADELAAYWRDRVEPTLTVHDRKRCRVAERHVRELVRAQRRGAIASGLVVRPTPAAAIRSGVGRLPYRRPLITSLRAA